MIAFGLAWVSGCCSNGHTKEESAGVRCIEFPSENVQVGLLLDDPGTLFADMDSASGKRMCKSDVVITDPSGNDYTTNIAGAAALLSRPRILEYILVNGYVGDEAKCGAGWSILHYAIAGAEAPSSWCVSQRPGFSLQLSSMLVKWCPDLVNVRNASGMTPLMSACEVRDPQIVELLLRSGAKVGEKGPSGLTAVEIARLQQCSECVELIENQLRSATH